MVSLKNAQIETHLPVAQLELLELVAVDRFRLEDAKGDSPMAERVRAHLEAVLPGGEAVWTVVASISEDQTYFCEEENKWEFCSRDDLIAARKADLERALRAWEKAERNFSWKPFQGLLSA